MTDAPEQRFAARSGRALLQLYPRGFKLFWLAPAVLALVAVPEFLQHIAEIRLGMFDSREAFRAHSYDPQRMMFGYAKGAGFVLAIFAAARFWWAREHGERLWDLRVIAWKRLALGFFLFMIIPSIPSLFNDQLGQGRALMIGSAISLVLLPTLFLMLAGLFGDRHTSAESMWRRSWPWGALMALLLVLAFVPPQYLHQMNHEWALGASAAVVWALMIFDSLLVGLLAGLAGTAFYLGYSAFSAAQRPVVDRAEDF
jgi:hypothetical protein